jgi:hypothetical protein
MQVSHVINPGKIADTHAKSSPWAAGIALVIMYAEGKTMLDVSVHGRG